MLFPLLEKLALELEARSLPYMVIGGQAVLLYGEPRLTRDIDITIGGGPEQLDDLLGIAHAAGWQVLAESPQEFVRRTMVLPCLDPSSGFRIDFIFSFSAYERQALARAVLVPVGSTGVRYATVEDVIIHKVVAGRPRDLEDVRGILVKKPPLSLDYIRRWLGEFDRSLQGSYVATFEDLWKRVVEQ